MGSPRVYVEDVSLRVPDIRDLPPRFDLAFSPAAVEQLGPLLYLAGELLPLPYLTETWQVLNIRALINCVNTDATTWVDGQPRLPSKVFPGGRMGTPIKLEFYESRLPEATLFKIPEQTVRTYCVEGLHGPEDDFKAVCGKLGLTGVLFRRVWDSEATAETAST